MKKQSTLFLFIALEYDRKAFITSYLIVGKSGGYMYNVKSKI